MKKVFKGIRGILSGTFLILVGNLVIQPYDWSDPSFIISFVFIVIFSFLLIMYGALTV